MEDAETTTEEAEVNDTMVAEEAEVEDIAEVEAVVLATTELPPTDDYFVEVETTPAPPSTQLVFQTTSPFFPDKSAPATTMYGLDIGEGK